MRCALTKVLLSLCILMALAIAVGTARPWEFCFANSGDIQWSIAAMSGRFYFMRVDNNGDTAGTLARRHYGEPPVPTPQFIGIRQQESGRPGLDLAGLTLARSWYEWRVWPIEGSDRPCDTIIVPLWWLALPFLILLLKRSLKNRHVASGLCPNCNYDLRAHNPGDKCPECGTPILPTSSAPEKN